MSQPVSHTTQGAFNAPKPLTAKRTRKDLASMQGKQESSPLAQECLKTANRPKQPSPPKFHFIYDRFTEARGDPVMLEIFCRVCNQWMLDYQKDGPGRLLRCYTDRIYHPSSLRKNSFTEENVSTVSSLKCSNCHLILAQPFIYHREKPKPETRPAYRILNDIKSGRPPLPRVIYSPREK